MSKGFSGVPGNMQALVKQAQRMQQELVRAQAEAESFSADGTSGGGMVKISVNGKQEIVSVTINPEVVVPTDVEMLQDLVRAAANEALNKVRENTKVKLGAVTGGAPIPGMF